MEELRTDLACPHCQWRAKNPTWFRNVDKPVCPKCGEGLRATTPLPDPAKTSWERLLEEVDEMADDILDRPV